MESICIFKLRVDSHIAQRLIEPSNLWFLNTGINRITRYSFQTCTRKFAANGCNDIFLLSLIITFLLFNYFNKSDNLIFHKLWLPNLWFMLIVTNIITFTFNRFPCKAQSIFFFLTSRLYVESENLVCVLYK